VPAGLPLGRLAQPRREHGGEYQQALGHLDRVGIDVKHDQRVADRREDDGRDQRAEGGSLTARERRPADDRNGE